MNNRTSHETMLLPTFLKNSTLTGITGRSLLKFRCEADQPSKLIVSMIFTAFDRASPIADSGVSSA